MYCLAICVFLPMIKALIITQIHRNAVFHPNSSCAFIRNASLSNDASIQSCIWECVYEHDCQTAVYFHDVKNCSMFAELCTTGSIEPSGNAPASVICYRKNHEPLITCSSTSTVSERHVQETSTTDALTSTVQGTTVITTIESTTTGPLIELTRKGDTIIGVYNTTAGQSTGGFDGSSYWHSYESPPNVIDNDTSTKYYNFADFDCVQCIATQKGIGTGFIVSPSISNATVACALLFATANDCPQRDPLTVTLEGSNATDNATLQQGSIWTLIYNGSTGINSITDPGRSNYSIQQNFPNTQVFASYRLLVTSTRDNSDGVQYSEARILGYV